MPTMPKHSVLLVEPWMAGSHEAWASGYQSHSRHPVQVLSGERHGWRATFDRSAAQLAARVSSTPDVMVASSMLDLATFRQESGFLDTPTLLYFHENQLTYDRARPDLARGLVHWRSVMAADRVAFNSRFHLDDFFDALSQLDVDGGVAEQARRQAVVLPVGIGAVAQPDLERGPDPITILWNHRWEYDKDPDAFVAALAETADLPFQLILAGEGSAAPRYEAAIRAAVGDRVLHAGFAPRATYLTLLSQSDLVVSTARQEFFGVSIAEAMAAGVVPLVPNRLAYPELLGPDLADCLYEPGTLAARLRAALTEPRQWKGHRAAARAAGARFAWELIAPDYDELIDSMV